MDFDVTDDFETLMSGGTVRHDITDELTYDSIYDDEESLWSILLMTGYLTAADDSYDYKSVNLRIPNKEIAAIFEDTVVRHFKATINTGDQRAMMNALWSGDEVTASAVITKLLRRTISYMDYSEDYYYAFLAGIFVGLGYGVKSNKESGDGRPDIALTDRNEGRVLIIEAKRSTSAGNMHADCETALRQIADNDYAAAYMEDYDDVMCYGVAFYRKRALVKKL